MDNLLNLTFVNQDDCVGNKVELVSSGTLKLLLQKPQPDLCNKWGVKVVDMLPRGPNIVEVTLTKIQEFASQAANQSSFLSSSQSHLSFNFTFSIKKDLPHPTIALHKGTGSTSVIIQQEATLPVFLTLSLSSLRKNRVLLGPLFFYKFSVLVMCVFARLLLIRSFRLIFFLPL